jgi:hypothetical protein
MELSSPISKGRTLKEAPPSWLRLQKIALIVGVYFLPLFLLWTAAGYPDDYRLETKAHGAAAIIENWWYSYLLLKHPNAVGLLTFFYMWMPVVSALVWLIYITKKDRIKNFDDDQAT